MSKGKGESIGVIEEIEPMFTDTTYVDISDSGEWVFVTQGFDNIIIDRKHQLDKLIKLLEECKINSNASS